MQQNYNYTNPMWNTPYSSNPYMNNNYINRNYTPSQPTTQQQQQIYQNNIIWVKGKENARSMQVPPMVIEDLCIMKMMTL